MVELEEAETRKQLIKLSGNRLKKQSYIIKMWHIILAEIILDM